MENEVKNQACPSPDGAEAKSQCCCCGCGGGRKKLAVAVIAAIVLIAIAAVVACCFIFDFCSPALQKYAPEGTDVIAYVNNKKIAKTKVWAAFKKTLAYEKAAKEAKKEGFDLDKAEQSEMCLFVEMNGKTPKFDIVVRGKDGSAAETFDLLAKETKKSYEKEKKRFEENKDKYDKAPKFSDDKIGGKKAVAASELDGTSGTIILLNKNTLQLSIATDGAAPTDAPLKAQSIELSKAIDAKALVSIVYKFELPDTAKAALKEQGNELFQTLANGLATVSLNLYDAGDDVELKLVGTYEDSDSAKKSQELLTSLHTLAKTAMKDNKKASEAIEAVKIAVDGKKVTLSMKYSQAKLVELIEEWDKDERAKAQQIKAADK